MNKYLLVFLTILPVVWCEPIEKIPCAYPESKAICVCPGDCLTQHNNNSFCEITKCYKWDNKCISTGESFYSALIFNALPPTGIIGIGDLIMKRLDLFAISLSTSLGGCIFLLCTTCCGGWYTAKRNDHNEGEFAEKVLKCYTKNSGATWLMFMILWWGYRLYLILSDNIVDGNGCKLNKN